MQHTYGGCKGHKIICEDIEALELLRKATLKYKDTPDTIIEVVEWKLFDWMKKRELYFVMGTHFLYGTWLIISLIYPKKRLERLLTEFIQPIESEGVLTGAQHRSEKRIRREDIVLIDL